nr:MAG TPA: hypothetical protein [Caudoviricetes sp.]
MFYRVTVFVYYLKILLMVHGDCVHLYSEKMLRNLK